MRNFFCQKQRNKLNSLTSSAVIGLTTVSLADTIVRCVIWAAIWLWLISRSSQNCWKYPEPIYAQKNTGLETWKWWNHTIWRFRDETILILTSSSLCSVLLAKTWTFPRCRTAARTRKMLVCCISEIPSVEKAFRVDWNSSESLTPVISGAFPCLR